jgi:hypothetical protein
VPPLLPFVTVNHAETLKVKTDARLRKGRIDSNEKWPQQETKILNKRAQDLKKGCTKSQLKSDLKETNPKFATWATDFKVADLYFDCVATQRAAWEKHLDKAKDDDLKLRAELTTLECGIYERIRAARTAKFAKEAKEFEKEMRKSTGNKAYSIDADQEDGAVFLFTQSQQQAKFNAHFAQLYAQLRMAQAAATSTCSAWHREVRGIIYPLHDWDDVEASRLETWKSDESTLAWGVQWQLDQDEKKKAPVATLGMIAPNPTALEFMGDPIAAPATVGVEQGISSVEIPMAEVFERAAELMKEKLSSGGITPEEYEQMMKVNEQLREMEEEDAVSEQDDDEVANAFVNAFTKRESHGARFRQRFTLEEPLSFTPLLRLNRAGVRPTAFLSGVYSSYRFAMQIASKH